MEDIIKVKTDNEKSYADEHTVRAEVIDYSNLIIDIEKFQTIILKTQYDYVEFEPFQLVYMLMILKELMHHSDDLLELVDRSREIFDHLEGRCANLL